MPRAHGYQARPARCAPVAQLDRASDYESEGRTFESFRAHQSPLPNRNHRAIQPGFLVVDRVVPHRRTAHVRQPVADRATD